MSYRLNRLLYHIWLRHLLALSNPPPCPYSKPTFRSTPPKSAKPLASTAPVSSPRSGRSSTKPSTSSTRSDCTRTTTSWMSSAWRGRRWGRRPGRSGWRKGRGLRARSRGWRQGLGRRRRRLQGIRLILGRYRDKLRKWAVNGKKRRKKRINNWNCSWTRRMKSMESRRFILSCKK